MFKLEMLFKFTMKREGDVTALTGRIMIEQVQGVIIANFFSIVGFGKLTRSSDSGWYC
jgi:hypothetical protein